MLAVALRRFRHESAVVAVVLAGVGLLALVTGLQMDDLYHSSGLADCLAAGGRCDALADRFGERFGALEVLIVPLVLLPALVGAFVGAPVVARELEAGTHRFLWAQGVSRRRWFASVSGVALGVGLLAGAVYAAIAAAWLDTTNAVTGERFGELYELQGLVPVGATVFAVAVAIACGTLLRRTLPAMAATLGVFVAVRVGFATLLRPRLAAVETFTAPVGPDEPTALRGAWVVSERTYDAAGRLIGSDGVVDLSGLAEQCPAGGGGARAAALDALDRCLGDLGVHTVFEYHPAGRFWAFQLVEAGVLLGLAGVAIALAGAALRRRAA
jgi:hypothetical protein